MHLTRSKKLTVRMGDFESFAFEATVGVSHYDLGYSDDQWSALPIDRRTSEQERLSDLVAATLDTELQADIDDAVELGQDRNSFLQRAFARPPLSSSPAKTSRRRTR